MGDPSSWSTRTEQDRCHFRRDLCHLVRFRNMGGLREDGRVRSGKTVNPTLTKDPNLWDGKRILWLAENTWAVSFSSTTTRRSPSSMKPSFRQPASSSTS